MEHVVLISKDVLRKDYLPTYGNTFWKTPNIDELAKKGTVFYRHYTAAPSTAMAFTSMFSGLYPYQTGRTHYTELEKSDIAYGTTLFDLMEKKGYQCHLLWSDNYITMAERFSRCYGANTVHHDSLHLNQWIGPHAKGQIIKDDDNLLEDTYSKLIKEIETIDRNKPVFLWVHLPHVMLGRSKYGGDIDVLDRFVGDIRKLFGDIIYITADHGSNDGKNGKTGYGFDVYESAINIPLIAPRYGSISRVDFPTSNSQLIQLIVDREIVQDKFVYSDTAYYAQPHRKLAIISGRYKYVYDKSKKEEFLYDVIEDSKENINLCSSKMYDTDRHKYVETYQVLFYPYWDEAQEAYKVMREEFLRIWRVAPKHEEVKNKIINKLKIIYSNLYGRYIKSKH